MIAKPQTPLIKTRANYLYRFMLSGDTFTKKDMCSCLGWEYNSNNERRIREIVALLATVRPIIATSDNRGYKVASTQDEVDHQINEINSRIEELKKRLPPLINFKQ